MKLVNGALLILGLALAFLSTSYAQGVRSGSAGADNAEIEDASDFENEDEEEQGSFERFLAGKMTLRCPFPSEVKRKYNSGSACKEGGPLFKSWKRCKNYCYVCPCWDEKSYYDFNGNLIENPCTPTFCEPQNYDYQTPCSISSPKRRPNCCPCHPCKGIEILPPDHFLCTPRCTDGTPKFDCNGLEGFVCDGECTCEDKECVSNEEGSSCSCKTPCHLTKPTVGPNGEAICDAKCRGFGGTCVAVGNFTCECIQIPPPCESTTPFPDCNGSNVCPITAACPPGKGTCTRVVGSNRNPGRCACQLCENDFLNMSDEELFNYAVTPGNRIGAFCYITTSLPGSGNACKYYAKEAAGGKGIPIGSGCVVGTGSFSGSCFYTGPPLTNAEQASMCTTSFVKNGAAQMRYAIRNKLCGMPC